MADEKMVADQGAAPLDEGWWTALLNDEAVPIAQDGEDVTMAADQLSAIAADWQVAQKLYENDEVIELGVIACNRGGLIVGLNKLRGFVPASHLLNFPTHLPEETRKLALARKVGQRLRLKIIECDAQGGRIVFSERAALASPGARRRILDQLQPGDVVSGQVTNICDFGVFVDLGGLEGLIHVSEVSWSRVTHPADVLRCDQTVQVKVLAVDREQERVALSLKRMSPDPWINVEQRYAVGQVVEGTVTNVVNFGAFVRLEEGLEGLIHISELAEGHFLHPRNVVHEGERVRAVVTSVDGGGRRLGLSLRRVPANSH